MYECIKDNSTYLATFCRLATLRIILLILYTPYKVHTRKTMSDAPIPYDYICTHDNDLCRGYTLTPPGGEPGQVSDERQRYLIYDNVIEMCNQPGNEGKHLHGLTNMIDEDQTNKSVLTSFLCPTTPSGMSLRDAETAVEQHGSMRVQDASAISELMRTCNLDLPLCSWLTVPDGIYKQKYIVQKTKGHNNDEWAYVPSCEMAVVDKHYTTKTNDFAGEKWCADSRAQSDPWYYKEPPSKPNGSYESDVIYT